nr:hypothetical protein Itr_chr06CG10430 [Ipomoea trifida]
MSNHASAESVQALQTAVEAMQAEQGEIHQLLAGKGPAGDDSGSHNHSSAPAATTPIVFATVPKFMRLEFPHYDSREDPTG